MCPCQPLSTCLWEWHATCAGDLAAAGVPLVTEHGKEAFHSLRITYIGVPLELGAIHTATIDKTLVALRNFPDYEKQTGMEIGSWTLRPPYQNPSVGRILFSVEGGGAFLPRAYLAVIVGYSRHSLSDSNVLSGDAKQLVQLKELIQ